MRKYYLQFYCHQLTPGQEQLVVDWDALGLHPDLIQQLAGFGIIQVHPQGLPLEELIKLQKVLRLRSRLGVNLKGAAIIAELLEKIEQLQDEIQQIKGR